jgi:hypothetical protein
MTSAVNGARHRSGVLTLIGIAWTNLKRDRVAQAMTFLLPIIFFSIFATVFGNQGNRQTMRIRLAVVDEDQSDLSRRMIEGMRKETGLRRSTARLPNAWCAMAMCRWRSSSLAGWAPPSGKRASAAGLRSRCWQTHPIRSRRTSSAGSCRK